MISLFSRLRTREGQSRHLPLYAELRNLGDVIAAPWGGHLVTSYNLCDQILRSRQWKALDSQWREKQGNHDRWNTPASQQAAKTLPMLNPPHHTKMRQSLGNPFDRKSLGSIKRSIGESVDQLLDGLAEELRQGEADFSSLISEQLPVISIGRWLGLPSSDYRLLNSLVNDQVLTQELFPSPSQLALADAATRQLQDYFTELVRERRKAPGSDPVSTWIRTWDTLEPDRELADAAVHSLAFFVLEAALETTTHMLNSATYLLLKHPRQLELLRARPEHIPDAVDEALRYDPPIHLFSRTAPEDVTLAGTRIREGDMVQLMVGAAHHDPRKYTDPEVFDVRRKAPNLGFGSGIHYCLGAPLARLEATSLLTALLARMPGLRLGSSPSWAPQVTFRRLTRLMVTVS
ncbi:cytochrome P450 [Streptomyces sp. NPDC088400]|uniref:cytochrome P450 n=1 Tax=Streptomyces sp. NPDC088400 TaxID=3365861 RepID=UPI0038243BAA